MLKSIVVILDNPAEPLSTNGFRFLLLTDTFFSPLQQHPLETHITYSIEELLFPPPAQELPGEFHDDVLRGQACIVGILSQALLAGGTSGQQLDVTLGAVAAGQGADALNQGFLLAIPELAGDIRAGAAQGSGLPAAAVGEGDGLAQEAGGNLEGGMGLHGTVAGVMV